jgi:hypothetical protein
MIGKQLASSVDHAMSFLRKLVPSSRPPAPKTRTTPRDKAGLPRAQAPSRQNLSRLELAHRDLSQEVSRQELELERMHIAITSGAPSADGAVRTGDRLSDYMENARDLRDKIQEKRLEIARLERRIARERQLLGLSAAGETTREALPVPPAKQAAKIAPISRSVVTDSGIKNALRRANIQEPAEQLLVEGIAAGLLSDSAEARRQALLRLGARPQPVVRLLALGADDPDERVRLAALSGLVGQKGSGVVELFRRFLHDKSPQLRLAALRGLSSVDAELLTTAELKATLDDPDPAVRRAAAGVISMHRDHDKLTPHLMRALCFALYDDDEAVRVSAAEALGDSGNDRAVLSLIRAVGDPAEAVSEAARRSLKAMLGEEVDAIAEAAQPEERVDALKIWWRTARVRLRTGPVVSSPVDVEVTTRQVLEQLASLKTEGAIAPPSRRAEPAPKPAPKPKAEAKPKVEEPKEEEEGLALPLGGDEEAAPAEEGETQDFENMFPGGGDEEQPAEGGEGGGTEGGTEGGGEEYENILGGGDDS